MERSNQKQADLRQYFNKYRDMSTDKLNKSRDGNEDSHHSLDISINKSTNNIESDIILFHDADDALLES